MWRKACKLFLMPLLLGGLLFLTSASPAPSSEAGYCAFCDPEVLERQKFYEDDLVMALYTHKPLFPGHCLIISKRHVNRFEELSEKEAHQITDVIKKVDTAVSATFQTSSYLLLQKNGAEVGQTVPHVHFHYIPRKAGENSTLKFLVKMYFTRFQKPIEAKEMEQVVSQLKQAILLVESLSPNQ